MPQHRRREPVHGDAFVARDCPPERRAFETHQVHVDAVRRQRLGVVPHTGAASQVSERDDDGSHDGIPGGEREHCTRDRARFQKRRARATRGGSPCANMARQDHPKRAHGGGRLRDRRVDLVPDAAL